MKMILRHSRHSNIMSQNYFVTFPKILGKKYIRRNYFVSICWGKNEEPTSLNCWYENRSINYAYQQQSEWNKNSMSSTKL